MFGNFFFSNSLNYQNLKVKASLVLDSHHDSGWGGKKFTFNHTRRKIKTYIIESKRWKERKKVRLGIFVSMSYEDKCLMREHRIASSVKKWDMTVTAKKDKWTQRKTLKNDSSENS